MSSWGQCWRGELPQDRRWMAQTWPRADGVWEVAKIPTSWCFINDNQKKSRKFDVWRITICIQTSQKQTITFCWDVTWPVCFRPFTSKRFPSLFLQATQGKSDRTKNTTTGTTTAKNERWTKILTCVFFHCLRPEILTEFVTIFIFSCCWSVGRKKWLLRLRKISKEAQKHPKWDATQYTSFRMWSVILTIIFTITWGLFVSPPRFPFSRIERLRRVKATAWSSSGWVGHERSMSMRMTLRLLKNHKSWGPKGKYII